MDAQCDAELLGGGPERLEPRIVELEVARARGDLDAAQARAR
jgi:hypothetical protein